MYDQTPLLSNLNPEQLRAVTLPSESALILAGAGSGKTRVLTTRIAWLLQTSQVGSGAVLAVTFTNKAATEMRARIEQLMGINPAGMWVGTFHGLAHRLLRAHWQEAGLAQNFQILDSDDQQRLIKRVIRDLVWSIWYPLAFWLLQFATTIVAYPLVFLRRRGKPATWVSPDRGLPNDRQS